MNKSQLYDAVRMKLKKYILTLKEIHDDLNVDFFKTYENNTWDMFYKQTYIISHLIDKEKPLEQIINTYDLDLSILSDVEFETLNKILIGIVLLLD